MKKEKKTKKHEIRNGHICFSSSFPHQQYFTFSYTHANILVALQKSLEVMCCFISELWKREMDIIFLHYSINICPVLTRRRRDVTSVKL